MTFVFLLFLIVCNGVFAMSEMAVSTSRKARLQTQAAAGDGRAQKALALLEHPNNFLSTVQVGITSIGMLNGILADAAFGAELAQTLQQMGMPAAAAQVLATTLVIAAITFVSIVFGELVPKRIGLLFPETIARWVAGPMQKLARMTYPFVWLLSSSTQLVLHLCGLHQRKGISLTEAEIRAHLSEGVDAGVIERDEHRMVHNVFHLDDRPLSSIMQPHTHIEWLEGALTVEEALCAAAQTGHYSYPVCKNGLSHVLGVISLDQLLACPEQARAERRISELVQRAEFLPETLTGREVLEMLRQRSLRLALVVDEYGIVQGLFTPFDMLEAIAGELQGRSDQAWAVAVGDEQWNLEGLMPIGELKARLDLDQLPEEERGNYHTLAGLLMYLKGDLPSVGDSLHLGYWQLQVQTLVNRRAGLVRATRLAANSKPTP